MSAKDYPEPVTDTTPPVPWWGTRPRDWPEFIAFALSGALAFICARTFGGQPLGIAATLCCALLGTAALIWWQRRRTPRPRQQREAAAAAGGSGL